MNVQEKKFFRFMMMKKICPLSDARSVFREISGADANSVEEVLKRCLSGINNVIAKYELEVLEGKSEVDGRGMVALVNTCNKPFAISAKFTDKKTAAVFGKLLSAIAVSQKSCMPLTEASKILSTIESSKTFIDSSMMKFERDSWIEIKSGVIYLGVRSLLELGALIATTFPQASQQCTLCRRHVFYGATCGKCRTKLHKPCITKYFGQVHNHICPSCKEQWNERVEEEVPAATSQVTDSPSDQTENLGPTKPKRARKNKK